MSVDGWGVFGECIKSEGEVCEKTWEILWRMEIMWRVYGEFLEFLRRVCRECDESWMRV